MYSGLTKQHKGSAMYISLIFRYYILGVNPTWCSRPLLITQLAVNTICETGFLSLRLQERGRVFHSTNDVIFMVAFIPEE